MEKKVWSLEDYFNHYQLTKRFVIGLIKEYNKYDFEDFKIRLKDYNEQFIYIYNKLPIDEKSEFKADCIDHLTNVKNKQSITKFKDRIDEVINGITEPQLIEVSKYNPDFKPSFFNSKGFELFNYIIDNYDKDGKIKYINIWYFLRYLTENTNGEIVFNFTQDKYKVFIIEKYGIKIKKFTKAEYGYDAKELPILKNIETDFRKNIV